MEKTPGKSYLLKPLAGLAVMGILIWAALYLDLSQYTHLERIRLIEQDLGPYGPLVFIALCMTGVLLHLPGIVLIAIGGVLFGGVMGFVLGWIGSIAGLDLFLPYCPIFHTRVRSTVFHFPVQTPSSSGRATGAKRLPDRAGPEINPFSGAALKLDHWGYPGALFPFYVRVCLGHHTLPRRYLLCCGFLSRCLYTRGSLPRSSCPRSGSSEFDYRQEVISVKRKAEG